ncbi:SDR family oxidoreductase [Natronorubrum bangense]|uniref:Short-chain dehydrogenase/reductase SDR n=2 Tax=Natronorubrum bangense TaxID=61858 RepID=L9W3U8_9EURY|nr:SDR family oxidoreductase [Natronorubrum bangense]ELY44130.1 short-chain dehydrogenase/reductase SDR [Natronorubrum bangense JCM 10635]QCC55627.1 SDR family oxidoreductase [Natronorubrum bangense]
MSSTTELEPPELTADDLLVLEDPAFTPDTVAIVTGAASGIGEALAVALAVNGLTVVGADIDDAGLEETATTIESFDPEGRFLSVPTDLTDDGDVEAVVDAAAEEGDLAFVANIAGMQHIDSIAEFPVEQYDLLQSVMIRAPFLLSKYAMPHIEESGDGTGAIANMSSVHGHYATQDKAAYITAKHALNGLTKSIAAEGGGDVRGFSVSVGYVLTPLMADQIADTAASRGLSETEVVEDVMLGPARTKTMMTPAEVANLFVFGFSTHATHLNGGDLLFDGGYTTTYE